MSTMARSAIDLTETAYDLSRPDEDWVEKLLTAFLPVVDDNRGLLGINYWRKDGQLQVINVHVAAGPADLAERKKKMVEHSPQELLQACTRPGYAGTYSELTNGFDGAMSIFQEHMTPMMDALGINALDPDGQGLVILAGREKVAGISGAQRYHLQQMAVHFGAGHRLRRELHKDNDSELPLGGDAVLNPGTFKVEQAERPLQRTGAVDRLRDAAKRVDRARGRMRYRDPEKALDMWQGLVDGRWSLVDWFDSDGRRYVIARPNSPDVGDPRGLTPRERQVATYAALGESSKLISYRLGIAKSTVSEFLSSAKKKLGASNHMQLIEKLRGPKGAYDSDDESESDES